MRDLGESISDEIKRLEAHLAEVERERDALKFVIQDASGSRNRDAGRISRALHRLCQLRDVPWWNPWKMRRMARKAMIELCPNDPRERFEIGEAVFVEWADPAADWHWFRVVAMNQHAIVLRGVDDPGGWKHEGDTFTATWGEIADIWSVEDEAPEEGAGR